jgi:CDGSH-type Zn-finger protein
LLRGYDSGDVDESALDSFGGVTIVPYRDGPYLVRGDFRLLDQDGSEITLGRRTIALCRCGKSRMRPFCDGTHRLSGFRAPGADERVALADEREAPVDARGVAPEAGVHRRDGVGALGQGITQ